MSAKGLRARWRARRGRLLREGESCWRKVDAPRLAFLIDAAPYYEAVAAALPRARRAAYIAAWDIYSGVRLTRRGGPEHKLRDLLVEVLAAREELQVYILTYDLSLLIGLERQYLPQFGWPDHPRLHFRLDAEHATGAAHHQKLVVIDDALAFAGGTDLTTDRWDTRDHLPRDERRNGPRGAPCRPFHEAQVALDGEAARALGELFRERWRRATGEALEAPRLGDGPGPTPQGGEDPWPPGLIPDLRDVTVGLARTQPRWRGVPGAREIERLYLDAIAAAREVIYAENQYLTSRAIEDALAARLGERRGPQVVLVLPLECPGWIEQASMGVLRDRFLRRLREKDRYGRLHVYYPVTRDEDGGEHPIFVHSKVLVVDDVLLRIGSANLTGRSMGLDTELDVALESEGDRRLAERIRGFRDDLLAEHLGVEVDEVARSIEASGSTVAAVERLRRRGGTPRTLVPLEPVPEGWLHSLIDNDMVDPDRSVEEGLVGDLPREDVDGVVKRPLVELGLALAILLGLAAAWRWTPLAEWIDPEQVLSWAGPFREGPGGALIGVGVFVVASLLMVPVTLLIVFAAVVFGPWLGLGCSVIGFTVSALLAFGIGRCAWGRSVKQLAGPRLTYLGRKFSEGGVLSVAAVRLVPVAPFTVVNLAAGSAGVRLRDFVLGTLLAMVPGAAAMSYFADRILHAAQDPGLESLLTAGGLLVALLLVAWVVRRRLTPLVRGRDDGAAEPDAAERPAAVGAGEPRAG